MFEEYVCPICSSSLTEHDAVQTSGKVGCSKCQEEYSVSDGIPILIPSEAYDRFQIREVCSIYDRAYQHPGIMGTHFDPEYSRVTKTTLLKLCESVSNPNILDVGTGDGDLWQFTGNDRNGYGIDISEVGVRRAAKRFPGLHVAAALCEYLPFPDNHFGAVLAADTIEHVFDIPRSLDSIRRVLIPGGIFAFSVPTPNSLRKWGYNRIFRRKPSLKMIRGLFGVILKRTILFGSPVFQPIDRDMTPDEWHSTVGKAGFKIESTWEWPSAPLVPIVQLISARAEK